MKGDFSGLHPIVLLIYLITVISFSAFILNPIFCFLALFIGIAYCYTLDKITYKEVLSYLFIVFLSAVFNPLVSQNGSTTLFNLLGRKITLEASFYGGYIGLMICSCIVWFKCFNHFLTSDKLIYIFGKLIPKTAMVLTLSLRYIPLFLKTAKQINNTQKSLGFYAEKKITAKLKFFTDILISTLSISLEKSIDTAFSMKARAYSQKRRTEYLQYKFSIDDLIFLTVYIILTGIVLIGSFLNITEFYFYPTITEISLNYKAIIVYLAFTALLMLPIILTVKENIKWKYLISKN